ncbi:hypothetical protein O181_025367 [Austropuccinia psidii MF-1]|uniref:Integrase catalytic domain-containing protein n=1 Tax=Austropuccinia psidii MF-1 TaxID=1389203 RepID=A0A9Q3GZT3_9BASI|nr:hypothetical protein [Austropuccinia psidii MF-1]
MCESRELVKVPGDVIVVDLVGPFPPSIQKHLYGLVIQDHFSLLIAFIPLQSKGEAVKEVLNWLKGFTALSGHKVKRLRSDNAGEFVSNIFNKGLRQLAIIHETSIPYEHHQNGKVEQANRTLSETARAIMLDKKVEIALWPWAFRNAAWVFNRILHAGCDRMPWELVTGLKPNVAILRVFGCIAYVHDHLHRKDLGAKSIKLIHLGVAQDAKGWLFWDPGRRIFIRGASAVFNEASGMLGDESNAAVIKTIEATRITDSSMIDEIEGQDTVFYLMSMNVGVKSGAPATYEEAMASNEKTSWEAAMKEELNSLEDMGVWEEVSSPGRGVLGSRWVYTLKTNMDGEVVRFKARAVVQGHRQIKGVNFEETFAPTPMFRSLRCLLAIVSAYQWETATFDVKTAYLNSPLEEEVFIHPPAGKTLRVAGNVLCLKKAMYGLKQAARCWWNHLQTILATVGFQMNDGDQSTYSYKQGEDVVMLWVHVDDGILAASNLHLIMKLWEALSTAVQLKWDLTLHSIVGIEVQQVGRGFRLSQRALIAKLLADHTNNFSPRQPLPNMVLKSEAARGVDRGYLSKIGMILYLAQAMRPNVTFVVNYLARFSMATNNHHWHVLRHLISYLGSTIDESLTIEANPGRKVVEMYIDANWGGEGSRSQQGYIGLLWGAPVMWDSKRKTCVASSTFQAEYMALAFGAKDFLWVVNNFKFVLGEVMPQLYSDNMAAIKVAGNDGSRKKARHIEQEFHVINEMVVKKKVVLSWVGSKDQLADIFTKNLGGHKVQFFKKGMAGV